MKIYIGYFVWCNHPEFREPEGTVVFDHDPKVGELVKLCDGKEWIIKQVREHSLEIDVELHA